jgi:hypothetical protein
MRDPIFLKYVRHPGYPFDDWPDEITSFHALISFWSEVFRAEVIGADEHFVPMHELEQDPEGPIFAVVSRDGRRGFRVKHASQALGASHSGFFVTSHLGSDFEPQPDAFTLDVETDFQEQRIEVIRSLMREQLNGEPRSMEVRNEQLDAVIEAHPHLFPAMVRTTRASREKQRLEEPDE